MSTITVADLTSASVAGSGVFDVLMRAVKAHLEQEYSNNRIKGADYATVYLGSMQHAMDSALQFLLQNQKIALEAQLLEQQILLAQTEVTKAAVAVQLAQAELAISEASLEKIPVEIAHIEAQTALVGQQTSNALAELAIIQANATKIPAEVALLGAQTQHTTQQKLNLVSEELRIDAQTALTSQQATNAITENLVLQAQKCKLDAEYDLLLAQKLKGDAEVTLLTQKVVTERAQTSAVGVDVDSVVGRQKSLYQAQTNGFARDAEQKAAKVMVDVWNIQRTTDNGIPPSAGLSNSNIDRAVNKMLGGVAA